MKYIEFMRPDRRQHPKHIDLDDRSEKLYQLCIKHPCAKTFTKEDCGGFLNLCFEAEVDLRDQNAQSPAIETMDVVCEIVSPIADMKQAWAMTVAKAADYLNIHIPDE